MTLIVAYYFVTLALASVLFKSCTEHISYTMYGIEIPNADWGLGMLHAV